MPTRPPNACSHHPHIKKPAGQRCPECVNDYERDRGNAASRGYSGPRWKAARRTVIARDPVCTCPGCNNCAGREQCPRLTTDADHHPFTRRQLLAAGITDPDHPKHLRGLCHQCHSTHTMSSHHNGTTAPTTPQPDKQDEPSDNADPPG